MKPKHAHRDFDDLKADPDGLGPLSTPTPKSKEQLFTIVSDKWERKLFGCSGDVFSVALFLLRQGRMSNWEPVKVSNVAMRKRKVSRKGKTAALNRLEALGLIKLWRAPKSGKSLIAVFRVRG